MKKVFGRLSLLGPKRIQGGRQHWKVQCVCQSAPFWVSMTNLKSGHTSSCGCLRIAKAKKRLTTHNLSSHHLYDRWVEMNSRCSNPENTDYPNYGLRGICVTPRWSDPLTGFQGFLEDMEQTYFEGGTIDRINPNGNYEPSNCRWLSNDEQQRNKTTNHFMVGSQEYYSWSNMKRSLRNFIPRWSDFKQFYKDMGPKPASARLRRHDRRKQHGPNNSYWG